MPGREAVGMGSPRRMHAWDQGSREKVRGPVANPLKHCTACNECRRWGEGTDTLFLGRQWVLLLEKEKEKEKVACACRSLCYLAAGPLFSLWIKVPSVFLESPAPLEKVTLVTLRREG